MFKPQFSITPNIAKSLMQIESVNRAITDLPLTVKIREKLRETAKLVSTHYSTMIEGNRLTLKETTEVIRNNQHFPGRERDEEEVLGYYKALDKIESIMRPKLKITETHIHQLHALVMSGKKTKIKQTPYRDGQNVIRDSHTKTIVYLLPEAKDVPQLMKNLVVWLAETRTELPCPIRAGMAHYQFATIHPYYDGNGRTARLLATLILHVDGYDLKGFYSLEEYYGRNLSDYYKALAVGPSHNYYMGRAEADISTWLEFFCSGMANAFENVYRQAKREGATTDNNGVDLRQLDSRQKKALGLFQKSDAITAKNISKLFGIQPRTARVLCHKWVEAGFIVITDPAKKSRKYRLAKKYEGLLKS